MADLPIQRRGYMEQTNNDIVENLARTHIIEQICNSIRVNPTYTRDLAQEIYLILLTNPNLSKMNAKELPYWLVKVIKNQYYGGPFYRRWRKHQHQPLETIMYKI